MKRVRLTFMCLFALIVPQWTYACAVAATLSAFKTGAITAVVTAAIVAFTTKSGVAALIVGLVAGGVAFETSLPSPCQQSQIDAVVSKFSK